MRYIYESHHRRTLLVPEYKLGPGGRVYIQGAKIYSMTNEYLGYWYRHNMPVNLITDLAKFVARFLNEQPMETNERQHRHVKA